MGKSLRVLPGFSLTMGISLLFITIVLLLPLSAMALDLGAMSWSRYVTAISSPRVLASYRVTLVSAAIASLVNGVVGGLFAWVLVRYRFPGRGVIDALIDLPFALPTAVAGITLASLFAQNGWYGQLFAWFGVKIAYTPAGIVIAMIFTSIPFVVRSVQPVLETLPTYLEEASATLGATPAQTVTKVLWPMLMPAWVTGIGLSFARSLGEFGAVIFIAGNQPYVSEIAALMIFGRLQEFDIASAAAIASVLLSLSLAVLLAINVWQLWFYRKYQGKSQ